MNLPWEWKFQREGISWLSPVLTLMVNTVIMADPVSEWVAMVMQLLVTSWSWFMSTHHAYISLTVSIGIHCNSLMVDGWLWWHDFDLLRWLAYDWFKWLVVDLLNDSSTTRYFDLLSTAFYGLLTELCVCLVLVNALVIAFLF